MTMTTTSRSDNDLMTTEEAAAFLNVHPETFRLWVRAGRIQQIRLGYRIRRYRRSDIEKFLTDHNAGTRKRGRR